MSGIDIVNLLKQKGYATPADVTRWLNEAFPTWPRPDAGR